MDNSNNHKRLVKEKDDLRKKIIENLTELYFLRNNGQMFDYQTWFTHTKPKDHCISPIINAKDDDLKNDQKFSQLLNLRYEEPTLEHKHSTNDSISPPQEKRARIDESPLRDEVIPKIKSEIVSNDITKPIETNDVQFSEPTSDSQQSINDRLSPPPPSEKRPRRDSSLGEVDEITLVNSTTTNSSSVGKKHDPVNDSPSKESNDVQKQSEINETTNSFSDSIKSPPEKKVRLESPIVNDEITPIDISNATPKEISETHLNEPSIIRVDKPSQRVGSKSPAKDDSPTRISKVVEPIVKTASTNVESNQQRNAEIVKHEAAVMARVQELRKLGLWSNKRLPKCQDPPRPKTHWDYLLEEARWLHNDYRLERKWKRDAARRMAYAAQRAFNSKRNQEERVEREKIQHIRKVAATLSKDVRSFWTSIEKIVDFRQQTKLEETRKKAWGLHLNYILDQTSKFSNSCLGDQSQLSQPPQGQDQQELTQDGTAIDYLIPKSEDIEKKEPVIDNEEQTASKRVDDMAAGAESIQPKGNTFETTTVSTKVPFLLKHELREYQHIGLDWLVAMYKKQLNGILADEMGLGKTIQTIALLAYLACEEQDWGPHLIVVPTSVMLNWEMEIKKWCPAFKILTYYGTPKERKMKRVGWSRPNSFHICITSYRIVIQDHAAFRRKQWCYLILDEAHYIKNFKSQRWQMLLNFNSQRRLLLTGTPLQNDLMELWSLMHFLMPSLFDSLREFKDWFVNPLTGMIEGSHEYNQELVQRLHKVLRPFLLRRLKADVEKQLPKKKEIIKYCRLSKRQRFLYEEFMSLSKTKETLASGNFLSVINVLMQLRKVCNHPNLFEPRPIVSPFRMNSISYKIPGLLMTPMDYNPHSNINLDSLQLLFANSGSTLTSIACDYIKTNNVTKVKLIKETPENTDVIMDCDDDTSSSITEIDEAAEAMQFSKITEACASLQDISRQELTSRLEFVSEVNEIRCKKIYSPYFKDIEDIFKLDGLKNIVKSSESNLFLNGNGTLLCSLVTNGKLEPNFRLNFLTQLLSEAIKSPEQIVENLSMIIDRFILYVPLVSANPISLHVTHPNPSKLVQELQVQKSLYNHLSPKFNFMNKIITNMRMSFPELRLIEYDCGKLQALGQLLTDLKSNDHRVLIFTQMSRMLDILEQFLNYHGHTYLRLDGATKIDQRQILMERFNNDKRIFCFILSTRSGGIGVNLTGADTVIFYDSDWNPTMDAQAQDRCHRIGQTRDVYIYRLISEDTIEQNIYRKAQQKRMLGDLAIEEGNFNTSCFKRHSIQELFERSAEPVQSDTVEVGDSSEEINKTQLNKFEQALIKCEVDAGEAMDVDAIKVARADVDTDMREFDENIPLTEESSPIEKSEKEQQIDVIVSQMTPVEQYAVKFLEIIHKDNFREELEQAEKEYIQELENKKSQWEQSRQDLANEQKTLLESEEEDRNTILTYPKGANCEHVQFMLDGSQKVEEMPLWAPPTPPTSPPSPVEENQQFRHQPSLTPTMAARIHAMGGFGLLASEFNKSDSTYYINENDVYVDYASHFLYEPNVMLESQLPPVNQTYTENEATSYTIGSKKIRLTGTPVVPAGYYQTPSQAPHLQQHLQNLTNVPIATDGTIAVAGQQPARKPKVRRDEVICLPRSLFDRPQGNQIKARRDLKLQKLRCVTKGNDSDPFAMQKFFHSFSLNSLGQSLAQETIEHTAIKDIQRYPNAILTYHQDQLPRWTIQEEWAILMVIQHFQDLPVNISILTPGHTPNWELVSEVVTDIGLAYRSFKMCEYHYTREVQKREMTRDSSWDERALPASQSGDTNSQSTKKSKKQKNQQQQLLSKDANSSQQSNASGKNVTSAQPIPFKPSKTGSMLAHDMSLQRFFKERYDLVRDIRNSRQKPPRSRYLTHERLPNSNNNTTSLVRDDKRLIDYDRPPKPETIIAELTEERKRRALAARQAAGSMISSCGCYRPAASVQPTISR